MMIQQEIGDSKVDYLNLIDLYELVGYSALKIGCYDKENTLSPCVLTPIQKTTVDSIEDLFESTVENLMRQMQ